MEISERRKYERYDAAYPLESGRVSSEGTLSIVNVSTEGVAFTSSQPVNENENLDLQIFLKNKMFNLNISVVYSLPRKDGSFNIGAHFIDVPHDFKELLEQEINEMTQFHQEYIKYKNNNLSFREVSAEYLKNDY